VCYVYRILSVSTIFLLDLGNVPTVWYYFCSLYFLFLTIGTTDGTLFVKIHVDEEFKLYNLA
jgi:hypothetical protein